MSEADYYKDRFPINQDCMFTSGGLSHFVGKHTYGVELIKILSWDSKSIFKIGRFCSIAHTQFFLGGNHPIHNKASGMFMEKFFSNANSSVGLEPEATRKVYNNSNGNIVVGNDVWLGNFSTIMSGVKIGNGSVVAANAHVTKDVPPYAIVGGNPAKVINYRFDEELIELLSDLRWWELEDQVINEILPALRSAPSRYSVGNLIESTKSMRRTDNLSWS